MNPLVTSLWLLLSALTANWSVISRQYETNNNILIHVLQTLREAVDAGGLGAHGITDPVGPDPLFTQGAVKASAASNIVAAVNVSICSISTVTYVDNVFISIYSLAPTQFQCLALTLRTLRIFK